MKVEEQVADAITAHSMVSEKEAKTQVAKLLETVGLPSEVEKMYPHELSGGMKQRVIIAMSQALEPNLIVADEPTTALDVTSQRLVLQSIAELRDKHDASIVLIAHDMAIHAQMVDRLAIMYAGRIIEIGSVYDIFTQPLHPYTQRLMGAIPTRERGIIKGIPGSAPSPLEWPKGCRFHPRCKLTMDICKDEPVSLCEVGSGRLVACHLCQK